jgi:hypothetical protein
MSKKFYKKMKIILFNYIKMEKLPTELILHQLSFMDNTSIKNLCKSNVRIHTICKNNKDFIKKIYYKNIKDKGGNINIYKRLVKICKILGINYDVDPIRPDRWSYVLDILLDGTLPMKEKQILINNPHLTIKLSKKLGYI